MTKWYHISMRSLRRVIKRLRVKAVFLLIMLIFAAFTLIFSIYNLKYSGLVYPNISVAGYLVSGRNLDETAFVLSKNFQIPEKIKLVNNTQSFELNSKDIYLSYDYLKSASESYNLVRTDNFWGDLVKRVGILIHPVNLNLSVSFDDTKLTKFISVVAGQDSTDAINPSVKVVNGIVIVNPGSAGSEVDQEKLRALILSELYLAKSDDISIPIKVVDNSLTPDESSAAKTRAEKYLGKNIQLKFEFSTFNLNDLDILKLLNLKAGYDENDITDKITGFSSKIERDPQNPKFTFDGGRVSEFAPALDGIKIDREQLTKQLVDSLRSLEDSSDKTASIDIPVIRTPPEVTTDKVNNLGIKELIGRGTSSFFHSIPGRVHNVVLAASRINGTLVKPGDTFSFNDTLGDVSAFTGYQQAYIISGGKTILGDGGGVCQVSTTLFRAILNAGLPIVERAAHAYRVGYYEQNSPPGLDATVYGPSPDLKFTNDTGNYILIEAQTDPAYYSLTFELYGTSDGRIATITKPVVSNITPALPTVYQDDPTLPVGTLKQTDFSAAGATVTFNYLVTRSGETIYQKTFISNYRPWAAVYLRGTKI